MRNWLLALIVLLLSGCGGGGVPIGATSANAYLSSLELSAGMFDREFRGTIDTYTAAVTNDITTIALVPVSADDNATVYVDGARVGNGRRSQEIPLNVGENFVRIKVLAPDEVTTRNYHLTIVREAGRNANLSDLTLSGGHEIDGYFVPSILSYTATVPYTTDHIAIKPSVEQVTASIRVNGILLPSGTLSQDIPLFVGSNPIAVDVTAQDGRHQQLYTINITRSVPLAASSDATLSDLQLTTGITDQPFSPATLSYTQTVSADTTEVYVTPTANHSGATILVNGSIVASGDPSTPIALVAGAVTQIPIQLVAEDGETVLSYQVDISRQARSDASLSALAPSSGTLTPAFNSDVTSYSLSVANAVSSLSLTSTASDALASIAVNGSAVVSGQSSAAIPLTVGANSITVVVTALDGSSQRSYSISATRQGTGNVNLSALSLSSGTLSPSFSASVLSYTASVTNGTSSLTVTPTAADGATVIRVNGVVVSSGQPSGAIALSVGANDINVTLTSADAQTSQSYVVQVTRAGVTADLSNLTPSTSSLNPTFSRGTTSYALGVGNATSQISFVPVVADGGSTVTVGGNATASGASSTPLALSVGANVINVVVTASDLSTKTYTVTVTRAGANNADLSGLVLSSGTLSPTFGAATTAYSASVASAVSSLNVTATLADTNGSLKINGVATTSGAATPVSLQVGLNSIPVLVTAEDGTTQKTYTLSITRAQADNAKLANLVPSQGVLSPSFNKDVLSYTISLSNGVSSIALTPTTDAQAASVLVNGQAVASGVASNPISLSVGSNPINVVVTAEDGVTALTYVVTAQRAASNDSSLSALTVSQGTLSPVFAPSTTAYSLSVAYAVTTLTVTPTTNDANATVKVNGATVTSGSASNTINLQVGNNNISVLVTAEDGVSVRNYGLVVTRAPSNNPDLASLQLSAGTLTPVFASATTSYTAEVTNSVSSISVIATGVTDLGLLKVNNITVVPGASSQAMALAVGSNTITVNTTAQDDVATNSYTVTVTRLPPSLVNADLVDLRLSVGKLDQTFQTSSRNYTANFGYLVSQLQVIATTDQADAALKVNGVAATSGQPSQAIVLTAGGSTEILIEVTGSDGVTKQTYGVSVSRGALASLAQQAYVKASNTGANDQFGYNVALSGDTLVVGAWLEDGSAASDGIPGSADNNSAGDAGAVYVFVRDSAGVWSQQAYLKPASVDAGDTFGYDVDIDGDRIVVSSRAEDSNATGVDGNEFSNYYSTYNAGAAYVYERVNGVWSKTAYLKPAINDQNPSFGISVALSGDTIVVGTEGDDSADAGVQNSSSGGYTNQSATDAGSATVFVYSGGTWVQQAYLKPNNPSAGDWFGSDVAIDGDTIVVGALYEDTSFTNSGAAYVFVRNNGVWSQQAMLKPVTGVNSDLRMGSSVDISGDTVVAGATKQDSTATDSGAVYVFVRSVDQWSEQAMLKPNLIGASDQLGLNVHIDGDVIVVGALGEDSSSQGVNGDASNNAAAEAGAGYVFTRSSGVWTQRYYLKGSNTGGADQFCRVNAVDGDTVVCATYLEDGSATGVNGTDNNSAGDAGAVYLFR